MVAFIPVLSTPMVVILMGLDIKGRPNRKEGDDTEQQSIVHYEHMFLLLLFGFFTRGLAC